MCRAVARMPTPRSPEPGQAPTGLSGISMSREQAGAPLVAIPGRQRVADRSVGPTWLDAEDRIGNSITAPAAGCRSGP